MTKLVIFGALVALAYQVSAVPLMVDGDIAQAVAAGNWEGVQDIIKNYVHSRLPATSLSQTALNYKSGVGSAPLLRGATVSGGTGPGKTFSQSEYSYSSQTNNNGKITEDKGGLGVTNDNGVVSYYTPKHDVSGLNLPGFGASPYGG